MNDIPDMKKVEKRLAELQERKDVVLELSRDMVRTAGKGITYMHAKQLSDAKKCMDRLNALVKKMKKSEKGFEYFSTPAHQEYVEALAFYTVLKERRLLAFRESGVNEIAYILGMMDLVGELKREIIEAIREGNIVVANRHYAFMKSIYDSTRAMRFANSLVPEFRRKQDSARIQLENAASELLANEGKRHL